MTNAPTPADLSPGALAYFFELARDAGNWSGQPLIGGNVEQTNERDGFLTKLKAAGLLTTSTTTDRINGVKRTDAWVQFTAAGIALAAAHGVEVRE